jgi:steroid 5-alpha reductase family enzyme
MSTLAPGFVAHLAATLGVTIAIMLVLWRIGVARRDVSIVDVYWGPGFAVIAIVGWLLVGGEPVRASLVTVLVTLWALRLGWHIGTRNLGHGEDPRYTALRRHVAGDFDRYALKNVFLLQGLLMWVVSMPVQLAQHLREPATLGPAAYAGIVLWLVGFAFESIGDRQLRRFKADPANAGRVMDRGLWRYTRHPNYFGDACVWWGLFLIACDSTLGLATIFAPMLMTWILVRWTGKPLLERRLAKKKPEYAAYMARTSGFVPWWPRKDRA